MAKKVAIPELAPYESPKRLRDVVAALNEPLPVFIPPYAMLSNGECVSMEDYLRSHGVDPDDPISPQEYDLGSLQLPSIDLPEEPAFQDIEVPYEAEPDSTQETTQEGATVEVPDINLPELGVYKSQTEDVSERLTRLKLQKLRILQEQKDEKYSLPHRYGRKFFGWQREFMECTEKDLLLTAANQVGKSTVGIATIIEWCGNKDLWPKLWPGRTPRQLWYMYPSSDFGTSEVKTKWVPDMLPRGEMMKHPWWGWRIEFAGRAVSAIHFNSGCSIYFKYYTQDVMNLQGSTVAAVFTDEELPEHFFPEINQRRMNFNGYFRMFFTATLGQKIWFDAMECQGTAEEYLPHAKKMQISLYDCKTFEDGSPSHITDEYIKRAINLCKSEAEIQKRVMGRFAVEGGLKYHQFQRTKHMLSNNPIIPKNWMYYVGVDIGSGGQEGHPSAIQFVAVNAEYTMAYCIDAWLGDTELTVDLDVYERLLVMLQKHQAFDRLGGIFYDYHSKDFGTICQRKGLSVLKAEKSHEIGESVINVLFKNDRLKIVSGPQHDELVYELTNLKKTTAKRHARDDAVDALRYALTRIPFAWEKIGVEGVAVPLSKEAIQKIHIPTREELLTKERRAGLHIQDKVLSIEEELDAWNELYDY